MTRRDDSSAASDDEGMPTERDWLEGLRPEDRDAATACEKCGRQPIGSYGPTPTTTYLCPYCNEGAVLRNEGVVVDRFGNVCHEACLAKAVA
jgi:hypothetical protein